MNEKKQQKTTHYLIRLISLRRYRKLKPIVDDNESWDIFIFVLIEGRRSGDSNFGFFLYGRKCDLAL